MRKATKPTTRDSKPTARARETATVLPLVPAVKSLYGLAAGHELTRDDVRQFLARKYGVDANL